MPDSYNKRGWPIEGRPIIVLKPNQSRSRSSSATPNPETAVSIVPIRQRIPISRLVKAPVLTIDGDEQEKRAFHFFRERTIPGLCGFFDSEIWERLVLQTTFREPALRHAIFALGSLHERFEMGDKTVFASNLDTVSGGLALRQYTQAINHVIKQSSSKNSQSLDVCLIACILFACFETLKGHIGSSISHLMSGVRILEESMEAESSADVSEENDRISFPYIAKEKLISQFNRLDIQVHQLLGNMPMTLTLRAQPQNRPVGFTLDVPEDFTTLDEARNCFEYNYNGLVKFFKNIEDNETPGADEHETRREFWYNQLEKWDRAFEAFLGKPSTQLTPKAQQAALALKITHRVGKMHLRHTVSSVLHDDMTWDLHPQEGEDIVQFAEALLALDETTRGSPGQRKVEYSLDMSLVGAVYVVAHKYRDPILRRRAIAILKNANRQEGIWDSAIAAKVAERIVAVEEGAVGTVSSFRDVPDWARIHGLSVKFDKQARKGDFSYIRPISQQHRSLEVFTETIYW
ncbi:MAG: hypothetical protein Q9195_006868 [Heterodermia aff. obscurata]